MKTQPKNENKFAAILHARQGTGIEEQESAPEAVGGAASARPLVVSLRPDPQAHTPKPTPVAPVVAPAVAPETPRRAGRMPGKGKSSDPRFKQVTAYIPQDLHENATIALRLANQVRIDAEKEDFSELLTRLLSKWYEGQNYYRPNA